MPELVAGSGISLNEVGTNLTVAAGETPEAHGAVGNGVTDDYTAFQALATAINAAGGGKIILGRGKTYLLNQNKTAANGILDVNFVNCNGLEIDLNGAKIKLKGGWDRNVSTTRSIMPLRFDSCSNVIVRNGEIDGSADTITNSSATAVPASYGFAFFGCDRVLVENIYTHHHIADGWRVDSTFTTFGGFLLASRDVVLRNVRSKFNVRLGVSIIQVRGMVADNCEFSYTGFNDEAGTVCTFLNGGGPKAGVDIEPNSLPTSATPVDVLTGNIVFINCKAVGNAAASLLCNSITSGVYRQENVHWIGGEIDHPDGLTGQGLIFESPSSSITKAKINMRDQTMFFGWQATGTADQWLRDNVIQGRSNTVTGIITSNAMAGGATVIEGNKFIGTHTSALTAGNVQFRFINPYADVLLNRFFLPAAAYIDATGTDIMIAVRQLGRRSEGNRYQTDLLAASGSGGTAHFAVVYDFTNTIARGERLVGAAIGWVDTFRPGDTATGLALTWDTNFLFNSNQRMNKKTAHDWASLASAAQQSTTVAVIGAAIGDDVDTRMSIALSGTALRGEVTAADTVTIYQSNLTGGAVDLGAGDIYATVTKRAA